MQELSRRVEIIALNGIFRRNSHKILKSKPRHIGRLFFIFSSSLAKILAINSHTYLEIERSTFFGE